MNVLLICIFTVRPGQDNIAQLQLADTPKRMGLLGKFIRDILCRWLHFFTKTASNLNLDFAHLHCPCPRPPLTLVCCTEESIARYQCNTQEFFSTPLHPTQHEKFCLQPIHSFQFQKPIVRSGTPTISSKFNQTFAPQHQKIWHSSRR